MMFWICVAMAFVASAIIVSGMNVVTDEEMRGNSWDN